MPAIRKLHYAYATITDLDVALTMSRICQWRAWMAMGWTADDIRLVVRMLQKKIPEKPRLIRSLRFEYLIGDTERFDGDLAEARALGRTKPPTPKETFSKQVGRPVQPGLGDNCKSAEDVMKANAALSALLKLRDSL